ncbi:MAG: redoxin domain-containing protein [Bacteroidales bacterium]|nr:redoxin domain-containing protein [Bacteroidales bacterium]
MGKRILYLFILLFPFWAQAQDKENYKIEIKIKGIEDSTLYLASYFADKTLLVDTAEKKGKNNFVFEGNGILEGGIYIVVGQAKNSIFEFLIADNQDLKFDSDLDNLIEKMKVKGSNENALFFDYLSYTNIQFKKLKAYQQRLKVLPKTNDSIPYYNQKLNVLNQDIADYKEAIIEAYPKSFISTLFLAMKSPEMKLNSTGKNDSIEAFRFYKKHFWDDVNFKDERLIRTPVFHNKLDYYFSSVAHPNPDSLCIEIDEFLAKIPEESELYKHSLWYLTVKFDESNRMGYDAILVYFVDHYYTKGKAPWLNDGVFSNIIREANKRRNSLIGKKAPNLVMQTLEKIPQSMYDINKAYTLLYFWDPNCSHCKEETPKLKAFYTKYAKQFDLEVFAVCADTNLKEMKEYIAKNKLSWINVNGPRSYTQDFHELYNVYSTPTLFVLNREKIIIAKQIKSDQLLNFLINYQKTKIRTE